MGKEGLTAKQVQHMKADPSKRLEIPVGSPTGLYLIVYQSGMKSWAFRYRFRGHTRKVTFQPPYYDPNKPQAERMSLAAARAEAEAKLEDLKNDKDPAAVQAIEIKEATPESVKSVANEWLTRYVKPNLREGTHKEYKRIIDRDVLKAWPDKLVTEIARPDVLRLLDEIVDRDAPIHANKVLAVIRAWFNWAVERGYFESSPAAHISLPSKPKSRDRVLTEAELIEVWKAVDSIGYPVGPFIRFLILTAQRRGEVAMMRWRDVDLDAGMWALSKEQTKAGRVHDVPLCPAAVALLKTLPKFKKGDFVWTTTSGEKAINGFSKVKKRIDARTLARRRELHTKHEEVSNIPEWTLHDLRRTGSTQMAKAGVPPHVLAAILNHTPGSTMGVTSIYNRFRYTDERRAALAAWAQYVLNLTKPKKAKVRAASA